jgi:NAD(P)H-dependent flavin oxidoreductase YrpB (nitropropane dioxygenase family)
MARRTSAPYGVGFFAFDLEARTADVEAAAAAARVVDVFWGAPRADVVSRVHEAGALVFWQVGSIDDALAAADAGCDAVVAQGVEAGGHVHGTTPVLELVAAVVARVGVPVVAAGGITTAARLGEVLAAGASAARVGTRFVATVESAAHPRYLEALVAADAGDTRLTTAFGGGWPDAPHRVLSHAIEAAASHADDVIGAAVAGDARFDIGRWSAMPPSMSCTGSVEAMAMYAGAGVGEIREVTTVAEVVADLLRGVEVPSASHDGDATGNDER